LNCCILKIFFYSVLMNNLTADKKIVPYEVKYRDDWRYINQQWIEKLFILEELDIKHLMHPEENILKGGGEIYIGLLNGKPVGAIALKHHKGTRYELSKMGVLPEAQGHGIAILMVQKIIDRYNERGGTELFLETNSSLKPAINLYKKMDFVEVLAPEDTPYERADYFMIYEGG